MNTTQTEQTPTFILPHQTNLAMNLDHTSTNWPISQSKKAKMEVQNADTALQSFFSCLEETQPLFHGSLPFLQPTSDDCTNANKEGAPGVPWQKMAITKHHEHNVPSFTNPLQDLPGPVPSGACLPPATHLQSVVSPCSSPGGSPYASPGSPDGSGNSSYTISYESASDGSCPSSPASPTSVTFPVFSDQTSDGQPQPLLGQEQRGKALPLTGTHTPAHTQPMLAPPMGGMESTHQPTLAMMPMTLGGITNKGDAPNGEFHGDLGTLNNLGTLNCLGNVVNNMVKPLPLERMQHQQQLQQQIQQALQLQHLQLQQHQLEQQRALQQQQQRQLRKRRADVSFHATKRAVPANLDVPTPQPEEKTQTFEPVKNAGVGSGELQELMHEANLKKRRLARKAELARASRRRKKMRIVDLEDEVAALKAELMHVRSENRRNANVAVKLEQHQAQQQQKFARQQVTLNSKQILKEISGAIASAFDPASQPSSAGPALLPGREADVRSSMRLLGPALQARAAEATNALHNLHATIHTGVGLGSLRGAEPEAGKSESLPSTSFVDWLLVQNDAFYEDPSGLWQSLCSDELHLTPEQTNRLLSMRGAAREARQARSSAVEAMAAVEHAMQRTREAEARVHPCLTDVLLPAQLAALLRWINLFGHVCVKINV